MTSRANLLAMVIFIGCTGQASAEDCGQGAFSAVVSEARTELQTLNTQNKQTFQKKLISLKQREGWSDEDYLVNARPFVQDDQIAAFDSRNEELLAQVPKLGKEVRSVASLAGVAPSLQPIADRRCEMLGELRGLMSDVVENARAKWAYLHGKADAALISPAIAEAAK
jgi:hypothetical protein